jgi:hypothetical protein
LFYYTPQTLTQTLEKNGFHVLATETFGLGLDEFINQSPPARSNNAGARPVAARKKRALRQIVKKAFFGAGLGENLLAIAQPV